jgi:hypothetical protein
MTSFIDDHRAEYGVEPICEVLPIAPSTYYQRKACEADRSRRSLRAQQDEQLKMEVSRVWDANLSVYGAEKVRKQLKREGFGVARCTVERLMRDLGLEGITRGRRFDARRLAEAMGVPPPPPSARDAPLWHWAGLILDPVDAATKRDPTRRADRVLLPCIPQCAGLRSPSRRR